MIYRQAAAADVDGICDLIKSAIAAMEEEGIHQWDELYPAREDIEYDISGGTMHLALEEGMIAAIYVLSTECDEEYHNCTWEGKDEAACVLHRFCVSPAFQHKGVGREVLRHAEAHAHKTGFAAMRLDVFSLNPHALNLYEKSGYKRRGFADWRMGRFYLMEKPLI